MGRSAERRRKIKSRLSKLAALARWDCEIQSLRAKRAISSTHRADFTRRESDFTLPAWAEFNFYHPGCFCSPPRKKSEIALTGSEILARGESEIIRPADSEITAVTAVVIDNGSPPRLRNFHHCEQSEPFHRLTEPISPGESRISLFPHGQNLTFVAQDIFARCASVKNALPGVVKNQRCRWRKQGCALGEKLGSLSRVV